MKKLNFTTTINAPKEKVWKVLWNDATYRQWTSVFCEGSYVVTDYKEGSKAQFLTPNGEGMYSVVAKHTPNEFMSFKHVGMIKEGKEQPVDEETKKWSGALESYTVKEKDGVTELSVDLDITDDHADYFKGAFPKGLEKVKELAEK